MSKSVCTHEMNENNKQKADVTKNSKKKQKGDVTKNGDQTVDINVLLDKKFKRSLNNIEIPSISYLDNQIEEYMEEFTIHLIKFINNREFEGSMPDSIKKQIRDICQKEMELILK